MMQFNWYIFFSYNETKNTTGISTLLALKRSASQKLKAVEKDKKKSPLTNWQLARTC